MFHSRGLTVCLAPSAVRVVSQSVGLVVRQWRQRNVAVMERRRRRGYKPEIKRVVALATIFGIVLVEVVIFFDRFPLFLDLLLLLPAMLLCEKRKRRCRRKQPSREFSVRYVTTYSTNVFPSPYLCIYSFSASVKNHLQRASKLFFFFSKLDDFFLIELHRFHHPLLMRYSKIMRAG